METPAKKARRSPLVTVAAVAGGLILSCCLAAVGALVYLSRQAEARVAAQAAYEAAHPWVVVPDVTREDIGTVKCPSANVCYLISRVETTYTLRVSSDSGATWAGLDAPNSRGFKQLACFSATTCIGSTIDPDVQTWQTTDGARSWHTLEPKFNIVSADCLDKTTCFVLSYSYTRQQYVILKTADGGANWAEAGTLIPSRLLYSLACPSAELCLVVGEQKGTIYAAQIQRVPTAGGTATQVDLGAAITATLTSLRDIKCPSANTCYAVGDEHHAKNDYFAVILKSTDAGATWARQPTEADGQLQALSCASKAMCVAVGSAGARGAAYLNDIVLTTLDGGANWHVDVDSNNPTWNNPMFQPHLTGILTDVSCPTETRCIVVGNDGLILRYGK